MTRFKLSVAAVCVVLVGVWLVRSFVTSGDGADTSASRTATTMVASPADVTVTERPAAEVLASGDVAGVPVGYPRTQQGAATAAVNWVASFPTIVRLGPIRLDDAMRTLLSQRLAETGSAEVGADYLALMDELGSDFARRVWIESPLQVDVASASNTAATVVVWALLVTGDRDGGVVEALWRTHRISLVWERGDWRIDNVEISEGPTPVPSELALPSPATEFVTVDGWEPAVFVDTTAGAR